MKMYRIYFLGDEKNVTEMCLQGEEKIGFGIFKDVREGGKNGEGQKRKKSPGNSARKNNRQESGRGAGGLKVC